VVNFQITHKLKEHCNSITTKSGIVVRERIGDNLVDEEVRKDKKEEEKNESLKEKEKIKKKKK